MPGKADLWRTGVRRAAMYVAGAGLTVMLVILGVRTHQQTLVWRNGLTLWSQALQVAPSYYGFNNRGEARRMRGDFKGAVADFNAAIRLKPRAPHAYNNRGLARQALGELNGAIGDYTAAVLLDPRDGTAYNNRGRARQASGDLIGATADYERAVHVTPQGAPRRAEFQRNLATARRQLAERRRRPPHAP